MFHPLRASLLLLVFALAFAACDSAEDETTGSITGQVTAADGTTPIPGVTVSLADAERHRTQTLGRLAVDGPSAITDSDGRFTLDDVPAGEQALVAQRGAFRASFQAEVEAGALMTVDAPVELESTTSMAYVPDAWDSIEEIVAGLGNEITEISRSDLADPAVTSQYGVIFINCGPGTGSLPSDAAVENLRAYVQNGGVLYASDWAGAFVETLYPDDIALTQSGEAQDVTATVVEEDVSLFVDGRSEIEIAYEVSGWVRVTELSDNATVLVNGVINDEENAPEPLAVLLERGEGRVVYTTFHNEADVSEDQLAVLRYFIYLP